MQIAESAVKRWTRAEYYRLAELGWFQDQRTELINGEIYVMSPQSFPHFRTVDRIQRLLDKALGEEYWVRQQGPVTMADDSEPEPDVSVVRGSVEEYEDHPTTAVLVVEVSYSTLHMDQTIKGELYARLGIPEFWIVNLVEDRVEIYREPIEDALGEMTHRYDAVTFHQRGDSVAPLEKPEAAIAVDDILPPA